MQLWLHWVLGSVRNHGLVWTLQGGGKDHGAGPWLCLSLALHLWRDRVPRVMGQGVPQGSACSMWAPSLAVAACPDAPMWLQSARAWLKQLLGLELQPMPAYQQGPCHGPCTGGMPPCPPAAPTEGSPPWDWLWGHLLSPPPLSPRQERVLLPALQKWRHLPRPGRQLRLQVSFSVLGEDLPCP